ncbi:PfkB family carbohydrate kinase [Parafrankia sp. FMc6]|uniref:carbohydrate kinase family protein n=1 Tax=Parafrankia soli TaxID=2599596 RepID=UPI0034D5CBDF
MARRWRAAGPALVVVTRGSAGAFAVTANHELRVTAPNLGVIDTVGAGDTFMGTPIAELFALGGSAALNRLDWAALAQVLCRCAHNTAITVSCAGADPPWASEIETTCIDSPPATTNG